ncbi:MAG: hypothetical protein WD045_08700 [Pirellulaceae bacterium]
MTWNLLNDPLRLMIAFCPLGAYLAVLGWINLTGRPWVAGGGRDFLALWLGLSGLVLVGPISLFMPTWAVAEYGGYTWLLMIALYLLMVLFVLLMRGPRLVIYNTTILRLVPALQAVAEKLDPEARWTDETLYFPNKRIHLMLDENYGTRNVQLKSVGMNQDYGSWYELEVALAQSLTAHPRSWNPYGIFLVALGGFLLGMVAIRSVTQGGVQEAFIRDILML